MELVSDIIAFATHLHRRVLEATSISAFSLDADMVSKLDKDIDHLPLESSYLPLSSCSQLDSAGTELWNACSRLMRLDCEWKKENSRLLVKAKVLAFLLVQSAASSNGTREVVISPSTWEERDRTTVKLSNENRIRLLNVSLETARLCLEEELLSWSLKLLEIAAAHVECIEKSHREAGPDIGRASVQEYYIVRIMLFWRQNRLDLAEHMFSKLQEYRIHHSLDISQNLAGACYRIGNWALSRNDAPTAIIWLDRALQSIEYLQTCQQIPPVENCMRLAIQQALVRGHLEINKEESWMRIREILSSLDKEHGNEISTPLLKLEVGSRESVSEPQAYYSTLMRVAQTLQLTDRNLELIIYYINKLRALSLELTTEALRQLLLQRLVSTKNELWIEHTALNLIWTITTSISELHNGLDILNDTMTELSEHWGQSLNTACAHASLILVWKKIDFTSSQENSGEAEKWCLFAQHPIFRQCNNMNKMKIKKKLILCALRNLNIVLARQTVCELHQEDKVDPLTTYLMYKVALKDGDIDLGNSCLKTLCQLESGQSYILACVEEARQSGNQHQVTIALQQLLGRLDYSDSKGTHLPVLLRYATRLLVSSLEDDKVNKLEVMENLCFIFETMATQAMEEQHSTRSKTFSSIEFEWFSCNSYNLAVEMRSSWPLDYILRLLNVSLKLIDLYPHDIGPKEQSRISARRMLCDFVTAVIIIAKARAEDNPTIKEEQYLDVRIHVQGFRNNIQSQLNRNDESNQEDWLGRYLSMLSFDFEATVYLKQWESLRSLIDEARTIGDDNIYAIFTDTILSSNAPADVKTQVFEHLIHTISTSRSPYLTTSFRQKLPRYFRCFFQLALPPLETEPSSDLGSTTGNSNALAESVLDRAYVLARDIRHSREWKLPYPDEELEWLATMTFNRAVDFYLASADEDSRRWGRKAIELAELMRDGGMLARLLKDRFGRLW